MFMDVKWSLTVVLIYIYLMTTDVKHFPTIVHVYVSYE